MGKKKKLEKKIKNFKILGAKNHRKYLHKHSGPPFQIRGGPGSFSIAQKSNVEIVRNLASAVYDHYVGFDESWNEWVDTSRMKVSE